MPLSSKLSLAKNSDDFFANTWQSPNDMLPYWRRHSPWRNDFSNGLYQPDVSTNMSRDFWEMDRRAREMDKRFQIDWLPIAREGFQVSMDVQQFSPSELSVTTNENYVAVEGKQEERQDEYGYIARQFSRRYILPPGYDPNTVTSELSADGILTIKAPTPKALEGVVRYINIQQTGPARMNISSESKSLEHKQAVPTR